MAKKDKKKGGQTESVLFDVLYEDGNRTSNRKVTGVELGGRDEQEVVRAAIEAQDAKIAEMSGVPRGRIKSVTRSK
jgi:hypothetical protein